MTLYLISCSKGKRLAGRAGQTWPAKDLYLSPLSGLMRRYVEARLRPDQGDLAFVLSAKYGCVLWDTAISPYDRELSRLTDKGRRDWAQSVAATLLNHLTASIRPACDGGRRRVGERVDLVVLAGGEYACGWPALLPQLAAASCSLAVAALKGVEIVQPLAGMGIGVRQKWLKEHQTP